MLASMVNGGGAGNINPFGGLMGNPAALIAFSKEGGSSLKDIMMLQMIQGCNFQPAPVAAAPAAPAVVEGPVAE